MKAPHTTVYRGKRVLVRLKDGTKFIDKYVDRTSAHVLLENHRVAVEDLKSLSIYREPHYQWVAPYGYIIDGYMAKLLPTQCHVTERSFRSDEQPVACGKPLNENGTCPEHGKVRYGPREKIEHNKPVEAKTYRKRRRRIVWRAPKMPLDQRGFGVVYIFHGRDPF